MLRSEEMYRFLNRLCPYLLEVAEYYSASVTVQELQENVHVLAVQELALVLEHAGLVGPEKVCARVVVVVLRMIASSWVLMSGCRRRLLSRFQEGVRVRALAPILDNFVCLCLSVCVTCSARSRRVIRLARCAFARPAICSVPCRSTHRCMGRQVCGRPGHCCCWSSAAVCVTSCGGRCTDAVLLQA